MGRIGRWAGLTCLLLATLAAGAACRTPRRAAPPPRTATSPAPDLAPRVSWGEGLCYAGDPVTAPAGPAVAILDKTWFRIGYAEAHANPAWVCYAIGPAADLQAYPTRRFRRDDATAARITHDDYTHSGFDRGHMAPRFAISSRFGQPGNDATFVMSNVCPQFHEFNDGHWGDLEEWIAGAKRGARFVEGWADHYGRAWVIVGPIFEGPRTTLPNAPVRVPSAFYCLVIDETDGRPRALAFILPNIDSRAPELEPFLATVDEVERRTGFDFFAALPDDVESALESAHPAALWPLPEAPN